MNQVNHPLPVQQSASHSIEYLYCGICCAYFQQLIGSSFAVLRCAFLEDLYMPVGERVCALACAERRREVLSPLATLATFTPTAFGRVAAPWVESACLSHWLMDIATPLEAGLSGLRLTFPELKTQADRSMEPMKFSGFMACKARCVSFNFDSNAFDTHLSSKTCAHFNQDTT
jgi:hypothetical protein